MKKIGETFRLSASDLAGHLGCQHLTALEVAVADGRLKRPAWRDPALLALAERGLAHEKEYVDHLRASGMGILELPDDDPDPGFERTHAAMRDGAEIITQGWLVKDPWYGRADVLRRVERPSGLGKWSYEVLDTKLARETRAGTVLQLCLYSDIVGNIQEALPEGMSVVSPGSPFREERLRVLDYTAYYRLVRRRLEEAVGEHHVEPERFITYPDPVPLCDVCRWWPICDRRRRDDDHLCLVASISSLQRRELTSRSVTSLKGLATITLPLMPRARRGSEEGYVRVHHQARIQLEGRRSGEPRYELLEPLEGRGLALLPEPDPGDVFLDLEGDPFVGNAGREYLFGRVTMESDGSPVYHHRWATTAEKEKAAFEELVDWLIERWERHPGLHVYHYAPYEPSALKRLMGRYGTREDEIDRMLRARIFVDLYAVVRQGLRASVERYSIKDLEVFYRYERELGLQEAGLHRRAVEAALELGQSGTIEPSSREAVEQYNRDDCVSASRLRDWLETLRGTLVADGHEVPRPVLASGEPGENLKDRLRQIRELADRLMSGVAIEPEERSPEEQARWLLAQLLEWHPREDKVAWWDYYRLLSMTPEELLDERAAISRLQFVERVEIPAGRRRTVVDRYRFPPQDMTVQEGDDVHDLEERRFGTIESVDPEERTVDIRKPTAVADEHPDALFAHSVVRSGALEDSLFRLGEWVAANPVDADGPFRTARDLLLRNTPRLTEPVAGDLCREGENIVDAAKRLVTQLDRGVLPIQGPPGAGKTYTGARMICELVRRRKRVGVTAVSHKVIRNLLEEIVRAAHEESVELRCIQAARELSESEAPGISEVKGNTSKVLEALAANEAQVGAGTAWLWSRPEYAGSVDVLFIDEAGQMTLADVLAVAQAAASLVLLGDPQQLEQPVQANHPEGTDVSALEHLLAGHKTVSPDRGLFLPVTWRLHPSLCAFTSELFYENRLHSRPGLERQVVEGEPSFAGAGLWFVPVEHSGNQSSSPEEVDAVAALVARLTAANVTWVDRDGARRGVVQNDILIIAPYNLQVRALSERLPGARIGTVDRFQGQEAPVVIYSMTTSTPEDAPRGMEFLYNLSRLNVATSRARTACILVANPRLFEPDCRTPRQMRLASAFCRFREMSRIVSL